MTNREAIEVLSFVKDLFDAKKFNSFNEVYKEALSLSIQALEKQEPKKPKQLGNTRYLSCVECGNNIETHWLGCPHCLTLIDWR